MPPRMLNSSNKTPPMSAEYLDALKILSEETMSQACALMLSEESNQDQLLSLYVKCKNASEVVQREAPIMEPPPTIPSVPASRSLAANRAQAKPLGSKVVPTVGTAAKSIMPRGMVRMALMSSKRGHAATHEASDGSSSLNPTDTSRVLPNPKKPRPQPRSTSPPLNTTEGNVKAPPPNALDFLAKLNKDSTEDQAGQRRTSQVQNKPEGKSSKTDSKSAKSDAKAAKSESSKTETKPSKQEPEPTPQEPTRTQPSRAARTNPTRSARAGSNKGT